MILNVQALILNMGGLMLDTERLYQVAFQKAASQLGFLLDDTFYLTLIGQAYGDNQIAFVERFGGDFPAGSLRQQWSHLWREEVDAFGIPLKPGLVELLEQIAVRNVPVAIATSSHQDMQPLA
jgi:beta-phosphoglucomutase-like phosphatase (HAD superfamily)